MVKRVTTMQVMSTMVAALLMLPVCATGTVSADAKSESVPVSDVIARVGDQTITFSEINIAINSSAIVGVSIPALGTPERDTARIVVLDRFVSANLLYLDALKQGTDKDPRYRSEINRYCNAILAGLYRKHKLAGEIPVSEEEVQAWYKANVEKDTELTDDVRLQIEARLRREKLHALLAMADKSLRDGVKVTVYEENLSIKGDETRADDTLLAEVGDETITWGQVKNRIISSGKGAVKVDPLAFEAPARRDALETEIDLRIMAQKAKVAGLDEDPLYRKRLSEYSKTLLINMHREKLAKQIEPADEDLKAYYEANRNRFVVPESRKLQMVVVKSKEQADDLKRRIEAGEMTMYEAVRDYSLAVNAKQDLGEVGWVSQGEMAPELDTAVFMQLPGELGEPVESPAGWHLVEVQEVNDARYTNFADETTRRLTQRSYMHDKLDAYTADLRMNQFPVEVYQERLVQLSQLEADTVKSLAQRSHEPGSVTEKRIGELQKLIKTAK